MPASVEFHTGVDDPVHFTCRLLRKAAQAGTPVLVTAPAPALAALDERLWTFDAQSFIPHVRVPGPAATLAPRTAIWLGSGPLAGDAPRVLVNLGAEPPAHAEAFDRVIEIVGTDDADRQAGRAHWRHYETWGVKPLHHGAAG